MRKHWLFYLMLLPALLDVIVFRYIPMYGVQIAFRQYKPKLGIWGSEWVGLKYFYQFASSPLFWQIMRNTLLLSLSNLVFSFPAPIFLALLLNEVKNARAKKFVQMVTYMPHFISTVAVVGLVNLMLDRNTGILNLARTALGFDAVNYMATSGAFRPIYVLSDIWQHTGWGAIIYIAALSSVDPEIVEAAHIDGVSRIQKILYIDIPTIAPTIITLLILQTGNILSVGFEKTFLMQNDLVIDVAEVISTYTYKNGILKGQFSYTSAIGLFNSVINAIVLVIVNSVARKLGDTSLW